MTFDDLAAGHQLPLSQGKVDVFWFLFLHVRINYLFKFDKLCFVKAQTPKQTSISIAIQLRHWDLQAARNPAILLQNEPFSIGMPRMEMLFKGLDTAKFSCSLVQPAKLKETQTLVFFRLAML